MIFPTTIKGSYIERMTDDEFFHFCQDNQNVKFERTSSGQIIVMSPTTFNTGDRNHEILFQIRKWNKKLKLGRAVDSDTGFYLPNGAMRNPDAAWVSNERLAKIPTSELDSFPHVCPNFIVELKSKSDSIKELKVKMEEWMANGCELGWLIDVEEEIVYVYEAGKSIREHKDFDRPISGEPVLSGFKLNLSELRV